MLTSLKKGMIKMSEGRSIKMSEKTQKDVRSEGEGQKLTKINLKWINFCMDKISRTTTSIDFCVVSF